MAQGAARGVVNSFESVGDAVTDLGSAVADNFPVGVSFGDSASNGVVEFLNLKEWKDRAAQDPIFGDLSPKHDNFIPQPTTMAGKMTEGVSQFVASFVGVGKLAPALKSAAGASRVANVGREAARGAVADFVGFKGSEDRLSDFLSNNLHIRGPVIEFLKHDPSDSEAMGRLKNALEGLGIGAMVEPLTFVVRAIAKRRKAIQEAKAAGASDEAAAKAADDAVAGDTKDLTEAQRISDLFAENINGARAAADQAGLDDIVIPQGAFQHTVRAPVTANNRAAAGITDEFVAGRPKLDVKRATNMVRRVAAHGEHFEMTVDDNVFNHATMDSPPLVQAGVEEMARIVQPEMDKLVQSGTKSLDTEIAEARDFLADALDLGADELIRRTSQLAASANEMAAQLVASKMYVQSLGREVFNLVRKMDNMDATDVDKAKLALLLQQWGDLTANFKAIRTGTARATSAGRIRTRDFVNGKDINTAALQDIVGRAGFDDRLREVARELAQSAGDPKQMNRAISRYNHPRWIRVTNELFINSLLSGPKTHIVNMTSNMLQALALPTEQLIGGVMAGNGEASMQAIRHFWYLTTALKGAGKAFWKAAKSGDNFLDVNANTLDLDNADRFAISSGRDDLLGTGIRGVGNLVRLPTRLLSAEDEFFKHLNYTAALKSRLHTESMDLFRIPPNSPHGEISRILRERADWVETKLAEGFDGLGRATDEEALQFAREATFTSPLRAGTVGAWVNKGVNEHPVLRLIMPFVRTPTNLLRQAAMRTPLGFASKELREELAAGGARAARARGKLATGSLIIGNIVYGVLEGRVTGGGPADPKQRANMLRTGWRPYSFVTTNDKGEKVYTSYARLDPWASLLGITADMVAISGHNHETYAEVAEALMVAIARNITQKSYLTGLVDILEAVDQPDRNMASFMRRFPASFVPTGAKQIAELVGFERDPLMRDVRTTLDAIKAKVPGLSSTLPAKTDWVTGQPVPYPQGLIFPDPIAPFARNTRKENRVFEELARLGHGFSPPMRQLDGVELEPAEYARLNELHGTVEIGGKTLADALDQLYRSSKYDIERKGPRPDGPESYRLAATQRVINRYRDKAKRTLKRELRDTLGERVRNQRRADRAIRTGRNPSTENDDLLKRLKQGIKQPNTF